MAMPHTVLRSATLSFLCYLFGKTERYLLVDFSFCRKDNHRKMTKRCLFLNCLFDQTKRHLIDIFSFCRKDNLKKISFCHLLDIFLLCRKDNLKKTTFSYLLVFCAVWIERPRGFSLFILIYFKIKNNYYSKLKNNVLMKFLKWFFLCTLITIMRSYLILFWKKLLLGPLRLNIQQTVGIMSLID